MRLRTVPTKLWAALKRGGVRAQWWTVYDCLAARVSPKRRRFIREFRERDAEWDRQRGTDTAGLMSPLDVGPVQGSAFASSGYQAIELRRMVESLGLDYPRFTFLDLGCGKGRAILVAAEYPFRAVIGVEFATKLHQAAARNIAVDRGPRRCGDVQAILGDAAEFPPPNGPLVVYIFDSFGASVMRGVLEKLQAEYVREPREIVILYNGSCPAAMFGERGFAQGESLGRFVVYRAGTVAAG